MKPVAARIIKSINHSAWLDCADNSGAKILRFFTAMGYKGSKRRYVKCGVGDVIMCSVKKGTPKMREETPMAVVIRQRKEYRRSDGRRIKFEDNAAVLVNDRLEPRGSEIKGAVAKEIVVRFPSVGKLASIVV